MVEREMGVVESWTDGLNYALHPLGYLLSGEQAIDIFPAVIDEAPLDRLRSATDADIAEMVARANEWCASDQIQSHHIRYAIKYTLRDWPRA